jgi:predicted 3-demethylubiquinone-9 3-methyltransferase (glyoxalase superfamily)
MIPPMAERIQAFLMFQGRAEEAMDFYVSLFPGARILEADRYGEDGPGKEGSVVSASFRIADQTIMCSDSPIEHPFDFTPSSSLFVTCEDDEEIERLFEALGYGGRVLMPLDDYGFSQRFAWVNDRFGVSWQLNLA